MHGDLAANHWAKRIGDARDARPFDRVCALAFKMGCRWVRVEDGLRRREVIDRLRALGLRIGHLGIATAVTLSFLRRRPDAASVAADGVLVGQATVVTYRDGTRGFVLEAILREPRKRERGDKPLLNNFVPVAQTYERKVMGVPCYIFGAYYCQEEALDASGADAALRTTLRCLGATPSPSLGRGSQETMSAGNAEVLARGLADAGYNVAAYDFGQASREGLDRPWKQEAWTMVCASLESGNPVVLVIADEVGDELVLAVVGYTVNTDEWHPGTTSPGHGRPASTVPSSLWIDHLVVHDPHQGPYLCLSRAWLAEAGPEGARFSLRFVILPLPNGVRTTPTVAETVATIAVESWLPLLQELNEGSGEWWERLCDPQVPKVARITLVTRDDYTLHVMKLFGETKRAGGRDELANGIALAPATIWLCEISIPQLYVGADQKLGEFVVRIDDDVEGGSLEGVVAFRLPSLVGWVNGEGTFDLATSVIRKPTPFLTGRRHANRW